MNELVTILAFLGLVNMGFGSVFVVASGQSQNDQDEVRDATNYITEIGNMAFECADQISAGDAAAMEECMTVVREFNVLMRQLDQSHGEIIQKYASQYATFGGSSTFGGAD